MGNCQAIDAATLVIQHPNGKVEKFYWPLTANEVMKMNPGHYVALLLSTTLCPSGDLCSSANNENPVRLTRIKLLRPTDTLVLGQVYKLITTQEVMKGMSAKKFAKMKKTQSDSVEKIETRRSDKQEENQVTKQRTKTASPANSATTARSRTWQPKLQSISEAGS
ncbi:hypothetical protein HS088_TW15G00229 [Tripterygium wilfordii]|uniref:DUF4228 domain protein n=1 Tax=Tripterygium wilfordii TaxID=458696 RepID=A0A7J7CKY7_TRIWF|nr:uncharacterized protein LOC120016126 [Tripterygium wilfordii]KAF5734737.1 hypothetical protein HS088_TW15G00229 [Tripterygium wilfordii]